MYLLCMMYVYDYLVPKQLNALETKEEHNKCLFTYILYCGCIVLDENKIKNRNMY